MSLILRNCGFITSVCTVGVISNAAVFKWLQEGSCLNFETFQWNCINVSTATWALFFGLWFSRTEMKMRQFVVSALLVLGFPFIMTEVVTSFNSCKDFFLDGQPPVIPGIVRNSVSQDENRYKLICQKYKNAYRFATLYDIANKIPVFSAYKYTGKGNFKRPKIKWMIESEVMFFILVCFFNDWVIFIMAVETAL